MMPSVNIFVTAISVVVFVVLVDVADSALVVSVNVVVRVLVLR